MSSSTDNLVKWILGILSALVIGAYTWVWNTNEEITVQELRVKHVEERQVELITVHEETRKNMQKVVNDLVETDKTVYGIERDMAYIKSGIDDIKRDIKDIKEKENLSK